jgi:peroxisomal 3,2-trans-enoyl-CoA isomerase
LTIIKHKNTYDDTANKIQQNYVIKKMILIQRNEPFIIFTINNPSIKNALTEQDMIQLITLFQQVTEDVFIYVVILTGSGNNFCSGVDTTKGTFESKSSSSSSHFDPIGQLPLTLINFPKLIISYVNGPAIGLGCTLLGLCDAVYATPNATFATPFVKICASLEYGSSNTFFQSSTISHYKSTEMIFFDKTLSAVEAQEMGLVVCVFFLSTKRLVMYLFFYTLLISDIKFFF